MLPRRSDGPGSSSPDAKIVVVRSGRLVDDGVLLAVPRSSFYAWTVIVGLYGMNFTHMPELGWRWGYPAVLVVMLIVGVLLVVLFRRRGWL